MSRADPNPKNKKLGQKKRSQKDDHFYEPIETIPIPHNIAVIFTEDQKDMIEHYCVRVSEYLSTIRDKKERKKEEMRLGAQMKKYLSIVPKAMRRMYFTMNPAEYDFYRINFHYVPLYRDMLDEGKSDDFRKIEEHVEKSEYIDPVFFWKGYYCYWERMNVFEATRIKVKPPLALDEEDYKFIPSDKVQ